MISVPRRHHSHSHDHDHDHDHDHNRDHHEHPHGPGHNHPHASRSPAQWQTPHRPAGGDAGTLPEPDLDKVEAAFVDGFSQASDPTSFLRLARIPFEIETDGASFKLLRVEIDATADVGAVTPHLGGESFRYDPLPANFVSQRRRLRFVYFDGAGLRAMSYLELRQLEMRG